MFAAAASEVGTTLQECRLDYARPPVFCGSEVLDRSLMVLGLEARHAPPKQAVERRADVHRLSALLRPYDSAKFLRCFLPVFGPGSFLCSQPGCRQPTGGFGVSQFLGLACSLRRAPPLKKRRLEEQSG